MKENNTYLEYLISDLEFFLFSKRQKIDEYIKDKQFITYKDSIFIFDYLVEGFDKTTNLFKHLKETKNPNLIRDVCILSSEMLSWIIFSFPSIEKNLEILMYDFKIGKKHIIDHLGENLILLDELIDKPDKLKFFYPDIIDSMQDLNMSFGYVQKLIKESQKEH
ncbi:MAG: hypothetical protein GXO22_08500 [Aquificae bacterium]|nr:hypothetical protein [Aquificota bacterium]